MIAKVSSFLVLTIWAVALYSFSDNPTIWFEATFTALVVLVIIIDHEWGLLRDTSTALQRPYSFSRAQLAWWSCIIISALIGVVKASKKFPVLDGTTLLLLGISGGTMTGAQAIDSSDRSNPGARAGRHQNQNSEDFFLDILSDASGVSIHRFQALIFNAAYGIWFLSETLQMLSGTTGPGQMPVIDKSSLALLGISSGTYAAVKTLENK
jgi:hypothetical protein